MPRRSAVPKYERCKGGGSRVRWWDAAVGKQRERSLGAYNSEASKRAYHEFLAEWTASQTVPTKPTVVTAKRRMVVAELADAFVESQLADYSESERQLYRSAVTVLVGTHPMMPVEDFGPVALVGVRNAMIAKGWTRQHINSQVRRVRGVFKWGESLELVPAGKYHQLFTLKGLKKSKSAIPEQKVVEPVDDELVEKTIPLLTPTLSAMVVFQRLTGCRPQDVCHLAPGLIDRTNAAVWVYRAVEHKGAYRGQTREVYIGPKAQAVLTPYLDWDRPALPVFSPRRSYQEHLDARRANRRPKYPSQVKERQQEPTGPSKDVGVRYTTSAYDHAIKRACDRGNLPHWRPNQLRHAAGTAFREEFGLDTAQKLLGHKHSRTTERYAKPTDESAEEAAKKVG